MTRPSSSPQTDQAIGAIFCLFAAIAWGTTGTAATFAPGVSPLAIGAAAMGIGGALQAVIAHKGILANLAALKREWLALLVGAVSVAIYPLAFYASMRLAGVTVGTVISIGSAPLISALIEYWLDGRRLTARWAIGAAIGLTGIALLSLSERSHGTTASNVPLGALLGLLAGGTYALYSWTAQRMMRRDLPPRVAMGATFGLGGLLLMPVLLVTGASFLDSAGNLAVGAYMALVPMFLGYLAFGAGLARVPASMATTITLFEPVVAAVLAVYVVGESLPVVGWLGVALIVACLIWTTFPWPRRRSVAV
ncbi:DMT family transporter [Sulfitobacter sp.]|jgi:DME family drug/metabolite transporter|uniref:DMT family transporter n=1 Tax=Sulfitobacter sp. TaxID=1903071 RepID=UPI0039E4CB59